MSDTYRVFRAFIASPSDVAEERRLAEVTIGHINRSVRDTTGATIEVRKWEHQPPVATRLPEEQFQDELDREVEECNFFILILFRRYGTIHEGHEVSNTEREINTILRVHQKKPQLKILVYFRDIEANADPGDQEQKVLELRARLAKMGIKYRTYRDPAEFDQHLTHDLYDVFLQSTCLRCQETGAERFLALWRYQSPEGCPRSGALSTDEPTRPEGRRRSGALAQPTNYSDGV